jgi:hypothetical protein
MVKRTAVQKKTNVEKWKEIAIQTKNACLDLNADKTTATKIREIGTAQTTVAISLKVN